MSLDQSAHHESWTSRASLLKLGAAVLLCFAAGQIGGLVTRPNLDWYHTLAKPFFNPPDAAFPIAWSILYLLMAVALWRVWMLGEGAAKSRALTAFWAQFVLNIAWSFAFFGAHSPPFGMVVVAALFLSVAWTIARFAPIDRLAAALLAPYLVWVGYAAALNGAIWYLNP